MVDILESQPYIIRSNIDGNICEEYTSDDGNIYVKIPIGLKNDVRTFDVQKAILIALQFIDNPEPNKYNHVLFEDNNKLNLKPDNLYWCSTDQLISRKYNKRQFVHKLPDDSVKIKYVNNYFFDHYYYSPSTKNLYLITKNDRIQIVSTKRRAATISFGLQDIGGRTRNFTMASFIKNMNKL